MDRGTTSGGARPVALGAAAQETLAAAFRSAGWTVDLQDRVGDGADNQAGGSQGADLSVRRGDLVYAVELKTTADGRGDRIVPLWSQAYLEAQRHAGVGARPLAVVAAPRISDRAAAQLLEFAARNAPDAPVGVLDLQGLRRFRGSALEGLNAEAQGAAAWPSEVAPPAMKPENLFSDLNQWMLKVLLAPELPESMLRAPRGRYRNATELADAAQVSVMSAYRFVQQLGRDGYLHESAPTLLVVRREELFRRWQAWSMVKRVQEIPMRFRFRTDAQAALRRLLSQHESCLGLFAAASALGVGHVDGVPPHVYVPRLDRDRLAAWEHVMPAAPGETPDFILRQAPSPQSVFRGRVMANACPTSDLLQVWLDVASHPARGAEQADWIRQRHLGAMLSGGDAHA